MHSTGRTIKDMPTSHGSRAETLESNLGVLGRFLRKKNENKKGEMWRENMTCLRKIKPAYCEGDFFLKR
jgi:hypothetical protein